MRWQSKTGTLVAIMPPLEDLLELVEGQTEEEDNKEMVSVPEHLKVRATDEL